MNKKVLVTIRGLQHEYRNCPDTEIQTIQQGIYKHIQDKHIITYEELSGETSEGAPMPVKNILKINGDSISLSKRGHTSTDMFFKKGHHHSGFYETPYGTLQTGIVTSYIDIKEEPDSIDIQIDYELEFNHSHISGYTIYINIHSI